MPDPSKVNALLQKTFKETKTGQLTWQETAETDVFSSVVSGGRYVLKSFGFTDYGEGYEPNTGPPSVGLFGKDNRLLLDVTDAVDGVEPGLLRDIFEAAKDSALGVDAALNDILDYLDNPDL